MLDATPLSILSHPNEARPHVKELRTWLADHLQAGTTLLLSEIADYEVRRELIRLGKTRGIQRLDDLQGLLVYVPLETATMRRAAQLWALARQQGQPTAHPQSLDADMILSAQAEAAGAIVVTVNVGHFTRFVRAAHWRDIKV
jgi:predicted nucleic acid-binding protein